MHTEKTWWVKPLPEPGLISALQEGIQVTTFTAAMLLRRGLADFESAKNFFNPDLSHLHDPLQMQDMPQALARLEKAIENQEKILVYGDYDVDGTTSVAMVYGFLSRFHAQIDHYIPDRYTEGYGVSWQGIAYAENQGVQLIIALDCGTKSVDKVAEARKKGIDFIICDHHKPGEELPDAVALLNPKRDDCAYPFKELSGCGVGFKLLQAYVDKHQLDPALLWGLLDLVAISIACDIVQVTGENRVLLKVGLDQLNTQPRPGLKMLVERAGISYPVDVGNLVFGIGPRINASGRIAHASLALRLLLTEDLATCKQLAEEVDKQNILRRSYDEEITTEALSLIAEHLPDHYATVLYRENWHKGVIGIVASRCIEKYYRPTIIFTLSNGKLAGSARSVHGFDIHEAIGACEHLLEQYGGHQYAAGLTMPKENFDAFSHAFEQVVRQHIREEQRYPVISLEGLLKLQQVNWKFYKVIERMAPFGPGNMRPVFVSEVTVKQKWLLKEKYLKMQVGDDSTDTAFDALAFEFGSWYHTIAVGDTLWLCYTIEKNVFNQMESLQLMVRDIKKEWQPVG